MKTTNLDMVGHSGVWKCRNGHVFMFAGARIPDGWNCECGQTKYEPKMYSKLEVDQLIKQALTDSNKEVGNEETQT